MFKLVIDTTSFSSAKTGNILKINPFYCIYLRVSYVVVNQINKFYNKGGKEEIMSNKQPTSNTNKKSKSAFRTISEVSKEIDVPTHVLRFWETKFSQISPIKRGGGRRYYRPEDVNLLRSIRILLYSDGYTIRGVNKLLQEEGVNGIISNTNGTKEETPPSSPKAIIANVPSNSDNQNNRPTPSTASAQTVASAQINKEELSNIMLELEELKVMLDDIIDTAA